MEQEQLERVTAALAEHYEIERELGQGGMATVYLARDLKHDRLVAVKVLHPDLAASLGAERFLREIQITARLSHPHILPLFDSGAARGFLYYVMPYVEGETLADYMLRERQLPIAEAVKVAIEVAEALGHAHSYGLVHRDIKPSNIMMTGGHAVVADFGIARAVEEAGTEKLTQTGMAIGTPAYMSPEQGAGDPHVDGRSDIYSLGCVLYEMLVGQIPFTGPSPQAILARHSMDLISPPHIMRGTVPDALEDVIYTAMAKTPADRYRTAQEFAEALAQVDVSATAQRLSAAHPRPSRVTAAVPAPRRAMPRGVVPAGVAVALLAVGWLGWTQLNGSTGTAASAAVGNTVAVLYFDDLSPGGELAFVADGLTDGLIMRLSAVPSLSVVSRNGVSPFRNADLPADSVASLLGAGTLVVGSVGPAGADRLRVSTRLVDGASGADVGRRASFELPRDQLVAAEDSVVEEVSRTLRQWLGSEIQTRRLRAVAPNNAAWALVQRGERTRRDAEAALSDGDRARSLSLLAEAGSLFAEAEEAAPDWAEPAVRQAETFSSRAWLERRAAQAAAPLIDSGLAHATRALEREPNHAAALEARGTLRYRAWQMGLSPGGQAADALLEHAYQDLDQAVRAEPSRATAHATLSHLQYQRKDLVGAGLAARRAYEADAYLANASEILERLHLVSYDLANFREAQRWCDEGTRRFPGDARFVDCHLWMLITPDAPPAVDSAWHLVARLDSLRPDRPFLSRLSRQVVAGVLGRAGQVDSARSVLLAVRTDDPAIDPDHELVGYEAMIRTRIGDRDAAIELLKRYVVTNPHHSFERGGTIMWWWLPLRDHPDFRQLVTVR